MVGHCSTYSVLEPLLCSVQVVKVLIRVLRMNY